MHSEKLLQGICKSTREEKKKERNGPGEREKKLLKKGESGPRQKKEWADQENVLGEIQPEKNRSTKERKSRKAKKKRRAVKKKRRPAAWQKKKTLRPGGGDCGRNLRGHPFQGTPRPSGKGEIAGESRRKRTGKVGL